MHEQLQADEVAQPMTEQYLRTKVMTAGAVQLQVMLFDGAIRFARQGRAAMAAGDLETAYDRFVRAERIVMELSNGLRQDLNPDTCRQMAALYAYIYRKLVDANMQRQPALADEAVELLEFQRNTWSMLLEQPADEGKVAALRTPAPKANIPETVHLDLAC